MKEDYDLEEELARSIATIVDEETAGARAYVSRTMGSKEPDSGDDITEEDEYADDGENDDDDGNHKDGSTAKRVIIIVAVVLIAVAAIGVGAYFAVTAAFNRTKDNYGYYNTLGYEFYDKRDYESAITNFEKALTYDEGKSDSEANINMMLYLYECYKAAGYEDKSEAILRSVLELDFDNKNAYYNLEMIYAGKNDYEKLYKLYEDAVETGNPDVVILFNKYTADKPAATPEGGDFSDDLKVFLTAPDDYKIYYTVDGTDPKKSSTAKIFSDRIEAGNGTTTIKFYSVNKYGFESDVMTEEYNVSYDGPAVPKILPQETTFSQSSKVLVTISNIQQGAKAYYTLDGNMPNEYSTEYDKTPIELPAGTTILTVLVVDEHGMTSTASRTYNVQYVSKYTQREAETFIWEALMAAKIIDKEHYLIVADKKKNDSQKVSATEPAQEEEATTKEKATKSEKETTKADTKPKETEEETTEEETTEAKKMCTLDYYSQKTIEGKSIYMFYFSIDGEMQSYWYGADADSGDVYKITGSADNFALSSVK